MDLLSPEDISAFSNSPFVARFWPTIVGGLLLFIVMFRGARFLMFMIIIMTAALQAWHLGVFVNTG